MTGVSKCFGNSNVAKCEQKAINQPTRVAISHNQITLYHSDPTIQSDDLILGARRPSSVSSQPADAQEQTRSTFEMVVALRGWLRATTKSPAFALSSAAINGLMLLSPLVSLADTTTYGTDSSSGTTYTGGSINSGDTVILNNGATVSGADPITANGTLQFNQTTNLTITNLLTGTGSLALINTGNLTLTNNSTVASIPTISAFDLGISLAGGSLLIGDNGGNRLAIGSVSNGTLTIAGGTVQDTYGYLGLSNGSNGTATVATGGAWTTSDDLFIGYAGNGNLAVSGGNVSNVNGVIGALGGDINNNIAGSNGIVTISGGNWTNSGNLTVGEGGNGTLAVSGGNVSNVNGVIGVIGRDVEGNIPGSHGIVIISGGNWTNSGNLTVGAGGNATLTVSGGNVSNVNGAIGYNSSATISGGNWTNSGNLYIATNNSTLTIGSGGLVSVAGKLTKTSTGIININAGGSLLIGVGGTTGELDSQGVFTNNGTIIFNRTTDYRTGSALSGVGSLIKEGSNILTLLGNSTYSGTTTINAGTLQIGEGANEDASISNSSIINNNASLVFRNKFDKTHAAQISGSGTFEKRANGKLTLTGNNTFNGTIQIFGGGGLQIGDGGTSGSLVSNVSGGYLIFNRSDSSTYGGVYSGSTVTKLGTGTLTLTSNNNSGTTTISAGTLQIGAGGTSGSLGSNIINNANLALNRSDAISYGGAISGSGNLTQLGAGTLTLTGSNSYTGNTTVSSGTLRVQGSIAPSSGLTVNSCATLAGNGAITGTTINAGGILAPNNAGSSALAITGGSGSLTLASGSISNFSIDGGNSDRVTASGSVNLDGVLNLAFSGDNYLTSSPYTLFTGQSLSGNFSDANVHVSGLSSSYQYTLNYTGTSLNLLMELLISTGVNASSLTPATFAGGTLLVDTPGDYATNYNTGTGGSIDLNSTTSAFSGVFSGTGSLTFTNTGTGGNIVLTGANTYTGSTTVANGATLSVNGSIASSSSLTINPGATIGGNGFLPNTTIQSGAVLAPGNSIGQITAPSLNFSGTLSSEIQGPQNDKTNVTGNVTNFTGTANLIAYGGGNPWPSFDYQLITASNSFSNSSSLTLNQSGVTSALLYYGTNLVQEADGNSTTFDVQWQPKNGSGATASAVSSLGKGQQNHLATASAFDRVFSSLVTAAGNQSGTTTGVNATGTAIGTTGFTTGQAAAAGISSDFLAATSQLLALTSGSQLTAAIDSLSPEPYAAYQAVGLSTLKRQRDLLFSQAGNCQSNGWIINAPETKKDKTAQHPFCVFAQANSATSSISGQDGLSSYNSGIFLSFYGLESQLSTQWSVGAAYGYGTSNLSNLSLTSASVSSDVNAGALYAIYRPDERWNIKALLGYSNFNVDGGRNVAYIGNGTTISGNTSANGYTAAINASYDIPIKVGQGKLPMLIKLIAGLAWGGYQQNGFTESGGGGLNLRVSGNTANSLLGTLGLEFASSPIPLSKNKVQSITPRLALAYQVDALANTSSTKSLTSSFVDAPSAGSFSTQGENGGANAFTVAGGFDLQLSKNASLYAMVSYEVQSNASQLGYGGGIRVKF